MTENALFVIGFWLIGTMLFSFGAGFSAGRYVSDERRLAARMQRMRKKAQRDGHHSKASSGRSRHLR